MQRSRLFSALKLLVISLSLIGVSSAGTGYQVIYSFTGGADGGNAATALARDAAGNLYGTTVVGGADNCGTVFKLANLGGGRWQESVLHSFNCFDEGKNPYGGVTMDGDGNLYGTTVAGGQGTCAGDGCGVVYKLSQSGGNWTETVLYPFQDSPDGWGPGGAVIFDRAGNLYGTTPDGGSNGEGTVYQLSQTNGQWTERLIHNFTGGDDGGVGSLGPLLLDSFGNIYGVTEIGGANGAGTAYKLTPLAGGDWRFTVLYPFRGQPDAGFPYSGLIADARGILYGTTYFGGADGVGAVFALGPGPTIAGWRDSVLYSFQGGSDGSGPLGNLLFDSAGNLLGTASTGGDPCGCGVVFKLTPNGSGWTQTVLHTFGAPPDAASPSYGLTADGAGNYFGATPIGGSANMGAVFEVTP